ncbi:hypothetical protein BC834DRAFT_630919 [Gloeopeniophorella convolvens]|nr:hypothetical protein BC834DRAFT_630919 [Gloeopeniophorella convolvens]
MTIEECVGGRDEAGSTRLKKGQVGWEVEGADRRIGTPTVALFLCSDGGRISRVGLAEMDGAGLTERAGCYQGRRSSEGMPVFSSVRVVRAVVGEVQCGRSAAAEHYTRRTIRRRREGNDVCVWCAVNGFRDRSEESRSRDRCMTSSSAVRRGQ